jgi:hypothetical protein
MTQVIFPILCGFFGRDPMVSADNKIDYGPYKRDQHYSQKPDYLVIVFKLAFQYFQKREQPYNCQNKEYDRHNDQNYFQYAQIQNSVLLLITQTIITEKAALSSQ